MRQALLCLLLTFSLSACAATIERRYNADWPPVQPDGSHTASVEDGPRPPLKQKWVFPTEGRIITSAAVMDGRVYVGSRDSRIYTLDLETGSKLSDVELEQGGIFGPPALTATSMFAGKAEAYYFVYGWERSGKDLWSRQSGELINRPPWVLADAARVYTHFDPPVNSPESIQVMITALKPESGETLWQTPIGGIPEVSPALGGSLLLVASNDQRLRAFDRVTGALRWMAELDSKPASAPLVQGERVYLSTQEGYLCAFEMASGKVAWCYQYPQTQLKGNLALSGNLMLVPGPKGLYTFDINELEVRWVYHTIQEITPPVASKEYAYFGSANHMLSVVRLANGALVGSYRLGEEILAAPVLAGGLVLVGASDGKFYAFEEQPQAQPIQRPPQPNQPPSWMQRR